MLTDISNLDAANAAVGSSGLGVALLGRNNPEIKSTCMASDSLLLAELLAIGSSQPHRYTRRQLERPDSLNGMTKREPSIPNGIQPHLGLKHVDTTEAGNRASCKFKKATS